MANQQIIGIKEVQKLLKQVEVVPAKVLTSSTKKGAKIAQAYAKSHIQDSVDGSHGNPPGTLRKSIGIKKEKRKKGKSVYTIGPGPEGWYAHFHDYGFTDRAGVKWQGNKFLRNSVDRNRGDITETILDDMGKSLDKLK